MFWLSGSIFILLSSLSHLSTGNFKSFSVSSPQQTASPQQREMMDQAAAQLAQDNCELACCFIQKTAVEKAGPEMDKRLATVSV